MVETLTPIRTQQRVKVAAGTGALRQSGRRERSIAPVRDTTQTWFWSAGWLEGEVEASRDLRQGRSTVFENADDFLASLRDS